jgi:DNA polymerase III subunit gamma/tau
MSYLVLARKWRPQVFDEVIGQRSIAQTLQNAISQKRVAHAFLFTGARGVGKTSTARILAKALNCEGGPRINPCNQCTTCHEVSSGNSMDVIEIDGASNRGIDEIRELRENVRYTPAKSRYKIYIIDEVHMLTREAFNALLKTLEEPPAHIIFIFATTEPHKIPATILSRCQRYDFKRIPFNEIATSLKRIVQEEQVEISQRGVSLIARASEGSMRDAESLLDQVISYGGKSIRDEDIVEVLGLIDQKLLFDVMEAISGRDAERCLEIVEKVYQYGYDIQQFCRELLQYLRNLILVKVSQHPEKLVELPEEELEALKRQAGKFQFDQLNHLFNLLLKGDEEMVQSTFPRMMLEMAMIRMATLKPILPIDEILKKLEGLERGKSATMVPEEDREQTKDEEPGEETDETEEAVEESNASAPPDSQNIEEQDREVAITVEKASDSDISDAPQPVQDETWSGLLDFTRARKPILGSFLALGSLTHLSEERIEIGFEKDSFHYERMAERENRDQLEQICNDFLQRKVKVIISPLENRMRSKGGKTSEGEGTARKEREKSENPLVQEALRLFDGRILDG